MIGWRSKEEIGEEISRIMNRLGMNQFQFAEALGIPGSQAQVSKWIRGLVRPHDETLEKIAELGNVPISVFQSAETSVDRPITPQEVTGLHDQLRAAQEAIATALAVVEEALGRAQPAAPTLSKHAHLTAAQRKALRERRDVKAE